MAKKTPKKTAVSRRERALQMRARMVESAYSAFSELGYRATTMSEVARRAEVAVQTVYFTFHTKAALLTDAVVAVSAGLDVGTPVMERAWMKEALAARDAQRTLALAVEHGTDIFRRLAPLWDTMVAAAAEDPEFAARFNQIVVARRRGMRTLLDAVAAKEGLKAGVSAELAADALFLLQSPQLLTMSTSIGWSIEKLKAWIFLSMVPLLAKQARGAIATRDLSFHSHVELLDPS